MIGHFLNELFSRRRVVFHKGFHQSPERIIFKRPDQTIFIGHGVCLSARNIKVDREKMSLRICYFFRIEPKSILFGCRNFSERIGFREYIAIDIIGKTLWYMLLI